MLERLPFLHRETRKEQAESIHQQVYDIYCRLPQCPEVFKDGPSWSKIKEEDLEVLAQADRGFLLAFASTAGVSHGYTYWAHTRENKSWIGFVNDRRKVTYFLDGEELSAVYEDTQEGPEKLLVSCKIESLDVMGPLLDLGRKICDSGGGPSPS